MKDMSLEAYTKHFKTLKQINVEVPESTKYQDLIENLKITKKIMVDLNISESMC